MAGNVDDFDSIHDKLLGLGNRSFRKNYYPELQKRIEELEITQTELRKYKDHLEELVQERTDELRIANEQLQQEIFERRRAEAALGASEKKYRQVAEDLTLLFDAGRLFSSSLELGRLLPEISRRCAEVFDVDIVLVRLLEDDRIVVKGSFYRHSEDKEELERLFAQRPVCQGEGIIGRVIQTGVPMKSEKAQVDLLTLPAYVGFLSEKGWLVVPMKVKDVVIGALTFITQDDRRQFSQRDVSLAQTIANEAAIAIENATLFDAVERELEERKQAEEALKESQQLFADIIEFLPDASLVIDREGAVIAWNRAMEEMTGIRAADMLGKGNHEYALPFWGDRRPVLIDLVLKPQAEIESKYSNLKRKDSVLAGEAYVPKLRGGEAYLLGTASILRDSKGNVVGAIESLRDITERKRVEEALRLAEGKYRGIFENALDGIFQSTIEGRFISCNPALARILGYDSPEELMHTISDISQQLYVNPECRSDLLKLIGEQGAVQEFEAQFFRKDRSIAWLSISARACCDKSGSIAYLEGNAQDVTVHKALESRLIQAQKMEAIGTLAGGIAHDFNNILAAILGYAELTKSKIDNPSLERYLEQILSACSRAKNLVGQILTFSRAAEQEQQPIDMPSLIREALNLLRATIPSTIRILSRIDPAAHTILADPTQIHQVLMNLFANAAHAMRERGGAIEIGLENVEITPHIPPPDSDLGPGKYLKLSVRDTGTGIAPEVRHRIFDPFFTTKRTGEGTGLGLSVVYGIAKGCGGAVVVQSEPGVGSTFDVYLPAIAQSNELNPEIDECVLRGSERVLFVDDEKILVEMWRQILEGMGYEVTATTDSINALEIFRDRPDRFDLVMTDMTMPGMTGMDLSKAILQLRPNMPIILCTGFNELITEEKAKAMGILGYTMKPLSIRAAAGLIRRTLAKA